MERSNRWLLIVLLGLTALEIAGEMIPIRLLHYSAKPAIMLVLIGWVWQRRTQWQGRRPVRWLLAGMVFALLGDSFLMIREIDLFAMGLASFLVMQLCYTAAFWQEVRGAKRKASDRVIALRLMPVVAYAGGFLLYLNAPFHRAPDTQGLWIPVVVYVACLGLMTVMAAMRREAVSRSSYQRVLFGAVLFMLSDSGIAVARFITPFPGATLFVMSTYAMAQFLLVTGFLQTRMSSGRPTVLTF